MKVRRVDAGEAGVDGPILASAPARLLGPE